MRQPTIDRRGFVRLLAGGVVLGGVALVEACAPVAPLVTPTSAPPKPTTVPVAATSAPAVSKPAPASTGGRTVKLPTRVPVQGFQPDLPGSADGSVDPAFLNYSANPFKAVQDTPGRGGEVNVMTWVTGPAPAPLDSNALWQAVNKELGVDLKINIQPQADYATVKLPTIVAGNDLPDILYIADNAIIPQLPLFLKSKMADLTPYLSGDAIKEYPNLANFSQLSWQQVIYNNAIYGVPVPYPLFLWVHWVHQNLLDDEGLARPKNAAEYKQLALHFTKPEQNLAGLGVENNVGMGTTNGWLTGIFGAPNIWGLDSNTGKLTAAVETEQYKAAVGFARDLWTAKAYHQNAMQYNLVSARNDFAARRFAFRFDGFQAASYLFWDSAPGLEPPGKPRIMTPFPANDGGKPTFWAKNGILGWSALKQAPPERIKELLRILNYLASPFGSQEYLLMNYGQRDLHWTPDARGNPVLNARGKTEAAVPFRYITQGPVALYYTRDPQYATVMQDAEKAMLPYLAVNPTDGYYSATKDNKYAGLARDLGDKINEIVVGRQPMSYWDQVVKEYLDGGVSRMRTEFEREIAAARS
jgi:putative aldouronate transport system substrate-binding protein